MHPPVLRALSLLGTAVLLGACSDVPSDPSPTPSTPTSSPTSKPVTSTPTFATPTPESATSTPEPATSTPEPATPTPEPATSTPEPATSTPSNQAPQVTFQAPLPDALLQEGASTAFSLQVSDDQDPQQAALTVGSSLDGTLYSAAAGPAGLTYFSQVLSVGTHRITALATDAGNLSGSASLSLRVNGQPEATIYQPEADSIVAYGTSLHFVAEVVDAEDRPQDMTALITSTLDGLLATPDIDVAGFIEADLTELSAGDHILSLKVLDSEGGESVTQLEVQVSTCLGTDLDGDGYGTGSGCTPKDCNDTNAAIKPGATETCNGQDDNCDAQVDEGVTLSFYPDVDLDGYGSSSATATQACSAPDGFVTAHTDCNDTNAAIKPGATETCNGQDDNCDTQVDEGVTLSFYPDVDLDGYGSSSATPTQACSAPDGFVTAHTDCDDTNAAIKPGATETCNGQDDNCDSQVDEGVLTLFYYDGDLDGYGTTSSTTQACQAPSGYVGSGTDCNDASQTVHPGATETCNAQDDNCDTQVDEDLTTVYYQDADNDGYGDADATTQACQRPTGYASSATDCDDSSPTIHPGATDTCNGLDDDCDTQLDEGNPVYTWYKDNDQDGYGAKSSGIRSACAQPTDFSEYATDCDDLDAAVHPGASDPYGDGIDADCDRGDGAVVGTPSIAATTQHLLWVGERTDDQTRAPVPAGDVDGDGLTDILLSSTLEDTGGISAGAVYLVTGATTGTFNLSEATAKLVGEAADDGAGAKAGIGDFNGDGFDDILVGAQGSDRTGKIDSGAAYLFYGPVEGVLSLSNANVIFTGETASDFAGCAVAGPGDLNGDGYDELLIGAFGFDYSGRSGAGMTYLFYGSSDLSGVVSLGNAAARFGGATANSVAGTTVSAAGDVNGDGTPDFLIGAPGYSSSRGMIFVIRGSESLSGTYDLNSTSSAMARYSGASTTSYSSYAGAHLSGAGDVNQDGFDDFVAGCPNENGLQGNVYLVLGSATLTGTTSLSSAAAILAGESGTSYAGSALSSAGDVNRDGFADLLIGSYMYPNHNDYGRAYLVLGPISGALSLTTADLTLTSSSVLAFGSTLTSDADWNGDGFADIAISSHIEDTTDLTNPGMTHAWYGPMTPSYILSPNQPRFVGKASGGQAGATLAGGGDLNGDGLADLLIGAPFSATNIPEGRAFLMLSTPGGLPGGDYLLDSANAILRGQSANDATGSALCMPGDVSGDQQEDLLIGARGSDLSGTDAGAVYLVKGPVSGSISLGTSYPRLVGEASGDAAGSSMARLGDLSGDGLGDFLVGAPGYDNGSKTGAGAAYLVRGSSAWTGALSLSSAAAKLVGEAASDAAGTAVASAGDFNGDGVADLLVGAPGNDGASKVDAGAVYLLFGPVSGTVNLAAASIRFRGATAAEQAGSAVAGVGDVNDDGFDDILIGAPLASPGGKSNAGVAYLVLGTSMLAGEVSLSTATAILAGEVSNDQLGFSVAGGDVSGDGKGDLIIGARYYDSPTRSNTGGVFLVTQAAALSGQKTASSVAYRRYLGQHGSDFAGSSVAVVGDTDGDGFRDLLIGAPIEDYSASATSTGSAYLIRFAH